MLFCAPSSLGNNVINQSRVKPCALSVYRDFLFFPCLIDKVIPHKNVLCSIMYPGSNFLRKRGSIEYDCDYYGTMTSWTQHYHGGKYITKNNQPCTGSFGTKAAMINLWQLQPYNWLSSSHVGYHIEYNWGVYVKRIVTPFQRPYMSLMASEVTDKSNIGLTASSG